MKNTKADGRQSGSKVAKKRGLLKRNKARIERRRAKANPETQATYGRYKGYLT